MRRTNYLQELKARLLARHPRCTVLKDGELCDAPSTELHHCLISKNKRFMEWINAVSWNFQPTCHECNVVTRDADRRENRMDWLRHQIIKYGAENLYDDWLTAPQKLKDFNEDWQEIARELRNETQSASRQEPT